MKDMVTMLNERIVDLEDQITKVPQICRRYDKLCKEYLDRIAELDNQIGDLIDSIEINKRSYAGLHRDYSSLKAENEKLHKTIGSLEEEIINRTAVTRSFYLKEIERLQGVIDRQQQAKSTGLWLVIETLETKFAEAQAEVERLRLVRDAASCIKHWHDSGEDGMVVSAEHVRKLWSALDAAKECER